jgi:hypothetical protein
MQCQHDEQTKNHDEQTKNHLETSVVFVHSSGVEVPVGVVAGLGHDDGLDVTIGKSLVVGYCMVHCPKVVPGHDSQVGLDVVTGFVAVVDLCVVH